MLATCVLTSTVSVGGHRCSAFAARPELDIGVGEGHGDRADKRAGIFLNASCSSALGALCVECSSRIRLAPPHEGEFAEVRFDFHCRLSHVICLAQQPCDGDSKRAQEFIGVKRPSQSITKGVVHVGG